MTNGVFINDVSKDVLKDILIYFIDTNCFKETKHYVFSLSSYKKGISNNSIHKFIENCRHYYCVSKQHYLNDATSYKTFITVLRQICNLLNIEYHKKIKYEKCSYEIIYYICMC
jgi:hypothetical protein